ncbi:unnamed protein product [Tenebrio molitor]|nr:unnamed protein product [Tenebrio molitor]
MVFTLEQNKFLMITSYRNGVKRDEEWTYSVQACKEEFLAKYLHQNVLEKCLTAHIHRIFNCFVTTGSVEKAKSSGRHKVMENVVENIRDHLEAHPRTYLVDCPIKLQYLLWRTINLGRQISDISKKSMQATIYCHYD